MQPKTLGSLLRMAPGLSSNGTCAAARPKKDGSKRHSNELVLELTVLAYNILRVIGQKSLKSSSAPKTKRKVKRRRIRTVINNLILIAGHVKEHARRLILSLGKSNIWILVFMNLHHQLVLTLIEIRHPLFSVPTRQLEQEGFPCLLDSEMAICAYSHLKNITKRTVPET